MDVTALVLYAAMGLPALAIGFAMRRRPRLDLLGNPDPAKLADPAGYSRSSGNLLLAFGSFSLAFGIAFAFAPVRFASYLMIALIVADGAFVAAGARIYYLRGTRERRER
jgi:hypothetical protein